MFKRAPIPEDKCFVRCAASNKMSPKVSVRCCPTSITSSDQSQFGADHLARHDAFEGSIALVTNVLGFDVFPSEVRDSP